MKVATAMANRQTGGRRGRKSPKTIDIEANPADPAKSSVQEDTDNDATRADTVAEAIEADVAGADTGRVADGPPDQEVAAAEAEAAEDRDADDRGDATSAGDDVSARTGEPASGEAEVKSSNEGGEAGTRPEEGAAGPQPVASPVTRVEKKTSFAAMLVSALLGGGIALAGAGLASRIPGIENVPGLGVFATRDNGGESSELQAANARIDEMQAKLDELASAEPATVAPTPDPAIAQRLDELEASLSALTDTAGSASGPVDQAAANEAARKADEALQQISELQAAINAGGATAPGASEDIAALKDEIGKVAPELQRIDGAVSELGGRIQSVEESVNTQILPAMETVKKAAETAERGQAIAKSVSARALTSVLEQGGEFSGELAAAEALAGPSPASEALASVAAQGLPTKAELLAGFQPLANTMIEGSTLPPDDAGVVARFMASAKSLVKVRPAGPVEGDTVSAIVSRVEAALKSGALEEAYSQWETLPESAKSVSADWAARLKMRIDAEKNLHELIGQLGAAG
jgi:hypothetical protein